MAAFKDTSQYEEAGFILDHFAGRDPAKLRFLDVGAFDGQTNSNTKPLADLGWSGVCVEPSPPAFCRLMKTHAENPRVTLVCAAVGHESTTWFHCNSATGEHCDQVSTFSDEHMKKWAGFPFRSIVVSPMSWKRLLASVDPHLLAFDFVNIDVEGTNLEVFESMPLRPEMVCVEADPRDKIESAVRARYRHALLVGGNWLGWEPR
jgi:FkbM family methyltransferase